MPQILTLPVPGQKRQSAWSSMTLPPANVFAVWACLSSSLRPCCQTEIAFKNWLYTTGTDSSSRYSANAMQLNKSCYITLSKDPGCHQMVCYGLWKTTMTVMTGHWSPWATSRPVRCPKSCVEATSLSTERGGGTAVKLDTFVALENESTMSLLSYRQICRAYKSKTTQRAGYFGAHLPEVLMRWWFFVFSWFCIQCRLQPKAGRHAGQAILYQT